MGTSMKNTVGELLKSARASLSSSSLQLPSREAALILGQVLELGEASLLARDDQPVSVAQAARFRALLERRLSGEPVAYLFGEREFWGREFQVDPRVLIPRPETEHLIEAALALDLPPEPSIVDIGSGSGCISVTLACELPRARVVACDISAAALEVTRGNARRWRVAERTTCVCTALTSGLKCDGIDLLVSNLPYVAPSAAAEMSPEVLDFEPHLALFAEDQGRALLRLLTEQAEALRPGAWMILEIGFDQGDWIEGIVRREFDHLRFVELIHDYAGHPRTVVLCRR